MRGNQRVGCHAFNMGFNVKAVMRMEILVFFLAVIGICIVHEMDD